MPPLPVLRGTYNPPAVRIGQRLFCRVRHKWCRVTSFTDAPISWPWGQPLKQRGGGGVVVNATLERAIRTESAESLRHFFGVTRGVVWRWRKAFGIPRAGTPGSAARIAEVVREGCGSDEVEGMDRRGTRPEIETLEATRFEAHGPVGSRRVDGRATGITWDR